MTDHTIKEAAHYKTVADVIEEHSRLTIEDWLERVSRDRLLMNIPMTYTARSSHLNQLFKELVACLRFPQPLGTVAIASRAAVRHGTQRRKQGYSAAMMVDESRMLQVSIFQTLQKNVDQIDPALVMFGVMAIADEVDSQLSQAMSSYVTESKTDSLPVEA